MSSLNAFKESFRERLRDTSEIAEIVRHKQWKTIAYVGSNVWIAEVTTSVKTSTIKVMLDDIGYHWSRDVVRKIN